MLVLRLLLSFHSVVGLFALATTEGHLQAGDGLPLWTNSFNGPANGDDGAAGLVLDANGNVFVTGYSMGTSSGYDFVTIKYSGSGSAIWTKRFSGPGNAYDAASALALDAAGNVYVTGSAYFDGNNLDYVTIKYSSSGAASWTNFYNGDASGLDAATAIAVDSVGNAYVTGHSSDGFYYGFVTIKYSTSGAPLWTNYFQTLNTTAEPALLGLDTNGNVYVSGSSTPQCSQCGFDYAIVKYSNAGLALWTNSYHASGYYNDRNRFLAVAPSGNVFVTGASAGMDTGQDFATVEFSTAGVPLWTNRYNGTGNDLDMLPSIALDAEGNVVVSGSSVGIGGTGGNSDYATIKYSAAGLPLWTNRFDGAGNSSDGATGVVLDASGNVYVTGFATGVSSGYDVVTIKYSPAGAPIWTNLFNGAWNETDMPAALAVDSAGNAYVAATSQGSGGNNDIVTLKYSAPIYLKFVNTTGAFTNNQYRLTLTGPPGSNAVISASTDLASWLPLVTNQLTGGTLQFTDALTTNFSRRLYRAALQ